MTFALTLCLPLDKLGKERPTASLLGWHTTCFICGLTFINFIFQVIGWSFVRADSHYITWPMKCYDGSAWYLAGDSWEAMYPFAMFTFQMTLLGLFCGFGTRFRKPVWENLNLIFWVIFYFIFFSVLVLIPDSNWLTEAFHFPQENHNRYATPSITWQNYQNVDESGNPKFGGGEADCATITMSESVWNQYYTTAYVADNHDTTWAGLYSSYGDGEVSPALNSKNTFYPGESPLYDQCVYDYAQEALEPGCNTGEKDGKFQRMDSDYKMPQNLRWRIWVLAVCNQLAAFLWVTQGVEGVGRLFVLDKYAAELDSQRIPLDL